MLIRTAVKHKAKPIRVLGGPDESPIGKGPGITQKAGGNSDLIVQLVSNRAFMRFAFPEVLRAIKEKRATLDTAGARGKYTGTPGMSRSGDYQFVGLMSKRLFVFLNWIDPTLFQDDLRLERVLKAMDTHLVPQ